MTAHVVESNILEQQSVNNSKVQFSNSPNLSDEHMNAIMDVNAYEHAVAQLRQGASNVIGCSYGANIIVRVIARWRAKERKLVLSGYWSCR